MRKGKRAREKERAYRNLMQPNSHRVGGNQFHFGSPKRRAASRFLLYLLAVNHISSITGRFISTTTSAGSNLPCREQRSPRESIASKVVGRAKFLFFTLAILQSIADYPRNWLKWDCQKWLPETCGKQSGLLFRRSAIINITPVGAVTDLWSKDLRAAED